LFGLGQIRSLVVPVCRDPSFSENATKINSEEVHKLCSFVSVLLTLLNTVFKILVERIGPSTGMKKAYNDMMMNKKPNINRLSLLIELAATG
jgi:hypothetical protein